MVVGDRFRLSVNVFLVGAVLVEYRKTLCCIFWDSSVKIGPLCALTRTGVGGQVVLFVQDVMEALGLR